MWVGSHQKLQHRDLNASVDGRPLSCVFSLGVYIDEHLSWREHIGCKFTPEGFTLPLPFKSYNPNDILGKLYCVFVLPIYIRLL